MFKIPVTFHGFRLTYKILQQWVSRRRRCGRHVNNFYVLKSGRGMNGLVLDEKLFQVPLHKRIITNFSWQDLGIRSNPNGE